MSTIASHSALDILETVRDRGLVPKDHRQLGFLQNIPTIKLSAAITMRLLSGHILPQNA